MPDKSIVQGSLCAMAINLVIAYVSRNSIPMSDLPELIRSVYQTLSVLSINQKDKALVDLKPAVSIKRSVTEDYIVCLEDGRKFKSLKRHLAGLGMTPADHRTKWGLSVHYPMVAPAFAKARSEMARSHGLGRKAPGETAPEPEVIEEVETPKKRGRAKKAA